MQRLRGRCTPTKSERHSKSPAIDVVDPSAMNDSANVINKTVDPNENAMKNKKKMPLKPGVRVKPPKQRPQNEIPISQNAPHIEEHQNDSQNLGQATKGDNIQSCHDNGPKGISAETMAATSSGTASRLFNFMPTPGFMPPRQK
ncbi:hypothetical protein PIB30_055915 [Stylosanthes scabra]|uniref:Uncharacterized protein n=1 Tax=Stylosanthes scabra TaxID=79078 RepID=A0ABU6TKV7_9FABA|nr:hypothetical protein [Stylosanthes scabra]